MTAPLPDPNGDRAEAAKTNREDVAYEAAQQAEVDAMNAALFEQLQAEQDAENALYDTSVQRRTSAIVPRMILTQPTCEFCPRCKVNRSSGWAAGRYYFLCNECLAKADSIRRANRDAKLRAKKERIANAK